MPISKPKTVARLALAALLCLGLAGSVLAGDLGGDWRIKYKVKNGGSDPGNKGIMDVVFSDGGASGTFSGNVYFNSNNGVPVEPPQAIVTGSYTETSERQIQGSVTVTDSTAETVQFGFAGRLNKNGTKMKWKGEGGDSKIKLKAKRLGGG